MDKMATTYYALVLAIIIIINIISANGIDPNFNNSGNDKKAFKSREGRYVAVDLDAVQDWMQAHRKVRSIQNPKEIIDSAEIDRNAPVEDFEDYSVEVQLNHFNIDKTKSKYVLKEANELNAAAESFDEPNETFNRRPIRNISSMKDYIKNKKFEKKKQKRSLALYKGKEISEESVGILNSVPKDKPKYKSAVKKFSNKENKRSKLNMIAAKDRSRRNKNNIIEEENLATTISGFKFTGRPSFLNNDIAFKNIHE